MSNTRNNLPPFAPAIQQAIRELEERFDITNADTYKLHTQGGLQRVKAIEAVRDYLIAAWEINHS